VTQHKADLAYQILQLQSSIEAYRRLHAEELDELECRLAELKSRVLISHEGPSGKSAREVGNDVRVAVEELPGMD
jgi:hypothetical protein